MNNPAPRILTLQLDEPSFTYFNRLRKQYFPSPINYLDAHVTLFHHLPATTTITQLLKTVAAIYNVMNVEVTGLLKLGKGVAFQLQSKEVMQLHAFFKEHWQEWLTPQDRQGFRPHVTVQNKVTITEAQALYEKLLSTFKPFTITAIGLSLWEYQGGPWQKLADYAFQGLLPQ